MKFVVSRGGTNNPQWLKDSAAPYTPEIMKLDGLPKGFRFELTDPVHIQRIKEGQMAVIDDGSEKNTAQIQKIDTEVREEERIKKLEVAKEVAKNAAEKAKNQTHKEWFERPVGIVILLVIAAVIACIITDMIFPQWFHS